MSNEPVTRYTSSGGTRIYRLPLRVFPGLVAYAYLVVDADYTALIDTGGGSETSVADLLAGMERVRTQWAERVGWGDVQRIALTHTHIDHAGGLAALRARSDAPIAVHTLERRPLDDAEGHRAASAATTGAFLRWAGVPTEVIDAVLALLATADRASASYPPATVLTHGMLLDGRLRVLETPGHSPGHVCFRLDDLLIAGDHILAQTNPRLTPEHLEPQCGLTTYLYALDLIAQESGMRLALAGHERAIDDVYARVAAIRTAHLSRLDQILALCRTPQTIAAIGQALYPQLERPIEQLQIAQMVAARAEYLEQQGRLQLLADAPATYVATNSR